MAYVKFNITTELRKAATGKKTNADPGVLLQLILLDHPELLQKKS